MGKTSRKTKISPSDFQVTTPKNPLIKNQAVTDTRNLTTTLAYPKIPTYSWTFSPLFNWTWYCRDFFLCMDLAHDQLPSNWCLLLDAKFFTLIHVEDLEVLNYKTLRQTRTQLLLQKYMSSLILGCVWIPLILWKLKTIKKKSYCSCWKYCALP